MIAANYRKHPDAMALQLVLPFGRLLVWATTRPTTKALRAIRSLRGAAFKAMGRIRYPEPKACPNWVKVARDLARDLAELVKGAQQPLIAAAGQDEANKSEDRYFGESCPPVHLMDGGWKRYCRYSMYWPEWLHGANDYDEDFERNN
jgi:hypothetical protein